MGQHLKGSVRRRGRKWLGSVPNGTRRMEYSFNTEAEMLAWKKAQIARIRRGLAPERPRRTSNRKTERSTQVAPETAATRPEVAPKTAATRPQGLTAPGRDWHHERYEEMEGSQADRSVEVLRELELHIFPVFDDLPGRTFRDGRSRIKDWLRVSSGNEPMTPGSDFQIPTTTYEKSTMTGRLWMLTEILAHARELDPNIPDFLAGNNLVALDKVGSTKRNVPLVDLDTCVQLAAQLHVIHQLVLWIMRLAGLRIREVYGVSVGRFFIDDDGDGFLTVKGQGGKFRVRDKKTGHFRVVRYKETGKTERAYRLVALPRFLTELIQTIIATYHTDESGVIDMSARLVPTIRSAVGGKEGFCLALTQAARAIGGISDDPDDYVVSHDLRKAFGTDLAWNDEISELLKRRLMGHRAGSDVFSLVYTLDVRLKKYVMPAALALQAELEATTSTLMIPTVRRPGYGVDQREGLEMVNSLLDEAGWQVAADPNEIGTTEAATLLGMVEPATRRLFPRMIPAVMKRGHWFTTVEAVIAFRDRLDGFRLLNVVAAEAGVGYHVARRTMIRLGITPPTDAYSRQLLLSNDEAEAILFELERVGRLDADGMTVAATARELGTAQSTVRKWVGEGRLAYLHQCDAAGVRYVTRSSITAELNKRGTKTPPSVSSADFKAATGFDSDEVAALVAARLLVRIRRERLCAESVRSYIAGYRPDLLSSALYQPLPGRR